MFTVTEWFKKRFRVIRDTVNVNEYYDKTSLLGIKFISKQDLCNLVNQGDFHASFDMAGWYDQFEYSNQVSKYLCCRRGNKYYRTTRLCMGQRHSCDIGQATTLFLLDFPGRRCKAVHAYIDNVIFVGSFDDVKHDSMEFIKRCKEAGVTLNETEFVNQHGIDACVQQQGEWCGVKLDFMNKSCSLIEKSIKKTRISWNNRHKWTHRQFSAHIGLLFWSWGIIDIPVYEFYSLLKFVSEISRRLQQDESLWDEPIVIFPSAIPALQQWTQLCLNNTPHHILPPSRNKTWFVCTDASKWGWGYRAFNYKTGEIRSHGAPWSRTPSTSKFSELLKNNTRHSVYAEPVAIYFSLAHLLSSNSGATYKTISPKDDKNFDGNCINIPLGNENREVQDEWERQAITVATDNTSAKCTFNRGFASKSYIINESIKNLKAAFPPSTFDFTFCFVPGHLNPADKPSRGVQDYPRQRFYNKNSNTNNFNFNNDNAESGNTDFHNLQRLAGEFAISHEINAAHQVISAV